MSNKSTVRVAVAQPTPPCDISPDETDKQALIKAVQTNAAHTSGFVAKAAEQGAQIVCVPEDVGTMAGYSSIKDNLPLSREIVRDTGAGIMDMFQSAAARSKIYVVGSAFLPDGDRFFNAGFLIDPAGQIIGKYNKTHPTRGEAPLVDPGSDYPVFDTELGKIGIVICADLLYSEPVRCLALSGAELVFCPTMGFDYGGEHMGEARVRMRAFDNVLYLALSMCAPKLGNAPGRSCIIGPDGRFLADAGYTPDALAWVDMTPGDRPPDLAGEFSKPGWTRWDVFYNHRRPHTYGVMVQPNGTE